MDGRIAAGERLSELRLAKRISGSAGPPFGKRSNLLTPARACWNCCRVTGRWSGCPTRRSCVSFSESARRWNATRCKKLRPGFHPTGLPIWRPAAADSSRASDGSRPAVGASDLDEETECLIGEADIAFHRILLESSRQPLGAQDHQRPPPDLARSVWPGASTPHPGRTCWRCWFSSTAATGVCLPGAIRRGDGEAAAHWMRMHMREGRSRIPSPHGHRRPTQRPLGSSLRRAMWRLERFETLSTQGQFTPPPSWLAGGLIRSPCRRFRSSTFRFFNTKEKVMLNPRINRSLRPSLFVGLAAALVALIAAGARADFDIYISTTNTNNTVYQRNPTPILAARPSAPARFSGLIQGITELPVRVGTSMSSRKTVRFTAKAPSPAAQGPALSLPPRQEVGTTALDLDVADSNNIQVVGIGGNAQVFNSSNTSRTGTYAAQRDGWVRGD